MFVITKKINIMNKTEEDIIKSIEQSKKEREEYKTSAMSEAFKKAGLI